MSSGDYLLKKADTLNNKVFIGKLKEKDLNCSAFTINKEKNTFKLSNKTEARTINYSGVEITDQTANYVLMNVKAGTNIIELIPVSEWFQFYKDPEAIVTAEEAEEKMRKSAKESMALENSLVRGKTNTINKETKGNVRGFKKNLNLMAKAYTGEEDSDNNNDDDAFKPKRGRKSKKDDEDILMEDQDKASVKSEDPPSDLEKILNIQNKKGGLESKIREMQKEDETESEDDSDFDDFLGKNLENKEKQPETQSDDDVCLDDLEKNFEFLNKKRANPQAKKVSLEETIDKLLLRYKSITHENLIKELSMNDDFTINDINGRLNLILDQKCSKFKIDGVDNYCKKINS